MFRFPLIPLTELLAKGLAFIIIIILTRILSIEDYGLFNYIVSLVLLVSVLMDGGINNYIFNKSVKNDLDDIESYFNGRMILSFIVICSLLLFVYCYQKEYLMYVFLYVMFVFFNSTLAFFKMLARGREYKNIDIQTIILDPFFRLLLLGGIFLLEINIRLIEVLKIFLGVEIFIFIFIYVFIQKYFKISFSIKNIFLKLQDILYDSKYFLLYYLFFVGIQRIDVLFINQTIGSQAVALFASAFNLYMVILLFFSSYLTSGFKSILNDEKKMINYIKNVILFYILIGFGIFIFSDILYQVLYPTVYFNASQYLVLFMISLPFTIVSYFGIYYFNYINKTYWNVIILFLFFIFKFSLLSFMSLDKVVFYVYFLIIVEILLGTMYLFLLIKNMKGVYSENTSSK